jgi:hypothetical protein
MFMQKIIRMDLSDLHGTDGSSDNSTSGCSKDIDCSRTSESNLSEKVEEMSHELLFQLNERDELVNAIQLKNRFIGKLTNL